MRGRDGQGVVACVCVCEDTLIVYETGNARVCIYFWLDASDQCWNRCDRHTPSRIRTITTIYSFFYVDPVQFVAAL